jgi:hypothetical protein
VHHVGVKMERALALDAWGRSLRLNAPWWFWNLFREQAVFLPLALGLCLTRARCVSVVAQDGAVR